MVGTHQPILFYPDNSVSGRRNHGFERVHFFPFDQHLTAVTATDLP
jgi:hypothetical protein